MNLILTPDINELSESRNLRSQSKYSSGLNQNTPDNRGLLFSPIEVRP